MKINIKATGIELTPAISQYTEKKVYSIGKYFQESPNVVAHVEVGKSTKHHKSGEVFLAEVHIIGAGLDLYAVSEQSDLYAAIDLVKDEIVESIIRDKGKKMTLARRGAKFVKDTIRGFRIFKRRQ